MSHRRSALAGFLTVLVVLLSAARLAPTTSPSPQPRPDALIAAAFVSDGGGRFVAPGPGGARIGVAPDRLAVRDGARFGQLTLLGADAQARPVPEGRLPGVVNDYRDGARRTGLGRYERVRYREVWDGVDIVYHGLGDGLEYDFALAPGADPSQIALRRSGSLPQRAPRAFQDGREVAVSLQERDDVLRFELGAYDPSRPLLIDPQVVFATLLGGSGHDVAVDATTDSSGNIILVGAASNGFPGAASHGGDTSDAFVSKLTRDGQLVWSTYLGGSGIEQAYGVALAPDGGIVVGTGTSSPNFPITPGAFQTTAGGGLGLYKDGAVTKLAADGTVAWSTYLSGTNDDSVAGVAVDPSGAVVVSGTSASNDFPVTPGGFGTTFAHGNDGFVAKLNPSGTGLVWAGFLGAPTGEEAMSNPAIASGGAVWVAGGTGSTDYPTTTGAGEGNTLGGVTDAVLTRIAADGSSIEFSRYFGGGGLDLAAELLLDGDGNVLVAGITSGDLPTLNAAQPTYGGGTYDGWAAKFSPAGALQWSTFIGGSGTDTLAFVAPGAAGAAYVSGISQSTDMPVTEGPASGGNAPVVATYAPDGSLRRMAVIPIGGSAAAALVIGDGANGQLLVGQTSAAGFKSTSGAVQSSRSGPSDAFLLRLAPAPLLTAAAADFGSAMVGASVDRTVTVTNDGDAPLTVSGAAIGGAAAGDYAIAANGCSTVAPGASCPVGVRFTPTAEGARAATLDLTTNVATGLQQVALTGTGTPYVPPLALSCGNLSLTILDVRREGKRVRVEGLALISFAGKKTTIKPSRGRGRAKATIQADGSFAATLPVPKRKDVKKVLYTASVGGKKSPPLRLDRNVVVTASKLTASSLVITAKVRGGRKGQKAQLRRRVSCKTSELTQTLALGARGVVKVTLARPAAGGGFAFYQLTTKGPGRKAFTLPIAVRALG